MAIGDSPVAAKPVASNATTPAPTGTFITALFNYVTSFRRRGRR